MKILVTGVGGQLGHDVMNELIGRGHTGVGSDIAPEYSGVADGSAVTTAEYVPMDITDAAQVSEVITKVSPDVVIHCAAWTAVDAAEDDDKKAKVKAINADGTQNIANVCKQLDCKMVYISTDYVFDGQGETPWEPDCKDYKPLNVYGETKLAGELAVSNTLDKYFIAGNAAPSRRIPPPEDHPGTAPPAWAQSHSPAPQWPAAPQWTPSHKTRSPSAPGNIALHRN